MIRNDAPPVEHVSWERLRDAYIARFGMLIHAEAEYIYPNTAGDPELELAEVLDTLGMEADDDDDDGDEPAPDSIPPELRDHEIFGMLTFGPMTPAEPRVVKASFGVAPLVGHEVFLATTAPASFLSGVLPELLHAHAPLSPGMVVRMDLMPTPFDAVLLAPPGAGSIPLGEVGGVERFALNVVPLMAAEAALAADSVDRLVAALRAHGVLEATDPLRDCVLLPQQTQRHWARVRPHLVSFMQHRLRERSERYARFCELGAPDFIARGAELLVMEARLFLRHIETRPVDPDSPAEHDAAVFRRREASYREVIASLEDFFRSGAVPLPFRLPCAHLLDLTLTTHPVADELFLAAEGRPREATFDAEKLLPLLVKLICWSWPDADPAALLRGGRRGRAAAAASVTADDGFLPPHIVWAHMLTAMLDVVEEPSTEEGQATGKALRAGVDTANLALSRETDQPPMERLKDMAVRMVVGMTKTWFEALGFEAPWDELPARGTELEAPQAPNPRKASKAKKGSAKKYH